MNSFNYFEVDLLLNYVINFKYFNKLYLIYLYYLLCDNKFYEFYVDAYS